VLLTTSWLSLGGGSGTSNPLNDLLSSMLGDGGAAGQQQSSGGSILDMLGGLLGAGRR